MRSNFFAIIFLAITISSTFGAPLSVNPNDLQSAFDLIDQIQLAEGSLSPLHKRTKECGGGCPDSSESPSSSDTSSSSESPYDNDDSSESPSDDDDDSSDSWTNSSNPTTNSSATTAVDNTGSNSDNNYFGDVDNSSSYSATNNVPSSINQNQNSNGTFVHVPVIANPNCDAPCNYHEDVGVLREVSTNGCPAQVQRGYSQCNVGTSSTTINGNLVSCSDIDVVLNTQTQQNICSVQPSNSPSFINILAFDCSQNGLFGIFRQKSHKA